MPTLDVAINARKAKQGAKQFDDATKGMQRSARGVDRDIAVTQKGVAGLGASFGGLAKRLAGMAAVYAVGRYVKSSIQEMAKFEMELANVSTMLEEASMRYLPKYKTELSKLAVKYGESTTALSKGLYDILSASVDAANALDVLDIATQAAKAGLTSTGKAADVLTTIINAYGMAASDASKISDILFATVKRGKTTFDELSSSLGMVVAMAATAGLSFEEVSAALATMTKAGLKTDIAVTSLRGILGTFLAPTQQNVIAAEELGLVLNTNTLRTIGLTGAVEKLAGKQAEQIAQVFSNRRALIGLSSLLGSTEGYMFDLGYVTDSTGKRLEAFGKLTDTTSYKLAQFREEWKATKRTFGEEFKPALTPALWLLRKVMSDVSRTAIDVVPAIKAIIAPFSILTGDTLKLAAGVTSLVPELSELSFNLGDAGEAALGFGDKLLDLDKDIKAIIPTVQDFNAEWEAFQLQMISIGVDWKTLDRLEKSTSLSLKLIANKGEITDEATLKFIKNAKKEAKVAEERVVVLMEEVRFEQEIAHLTGEVRERAIKLRELETAAKVLGTAASAELRKEYVKELDVLQKIEETKKRTAAIVEAKEEAAGLIREVELEQELLYLTNEERERAIKLQRLEAVTKVLGAEESTRLKEAYIAELEQLRDMKEIEALVENVRTGVGDLIRAPLTALLDETRDMGDVLNDVLRDIGQNILQTLYQQMIVQPLQNMLMSALKGAMGGGGGAVGGLGGLIAALFAEKGLVFNSGQVQSFGAGTIINKPTIFPMANGNVGLMGEKGEEAVMPLARDKSGRLGVRTDGAQAAPSLKIVNVLDGSVFEDYLATGEGERAIVNIMRRNRGEI